MRVFYKYLISVGAVMSSCFLFAGCSYFNKYPVDGLSTNSKGDSCEVLRPSEENLPSFYISKPGRYCLIRSYSCNKSYIGWDESGTCSSMLGVWADDVDVDLMGHTLSGHNLVAGRAENVSIRNGVLDGGAVTIGKKGAPGSLPIRAHWILEDISVRGVGAEISSFGIDNIIRNSKFDITIEDSSGIKYFPIEYPRDAAIVHSGSGFIFENNTLDVNIDSMSGSRPAYGAYLTDASDSSIKGNVIRFRGKTENTCAIGLNKSTDVNYENNVVKNSESPIELSSDSGIRK